MQRIPLTQVQMPISLRSVDKVQCVNPGNILPEFISSPLYVHEFCLDNSLVQEIFSYTYALAGYFSSKSPNPPPPFRSKMVGPLTSLAPDRTGNIGPRSFLYGLRCARANIPQYGPRVQLVRG